jgi:hypothetical protein
MWGVVKLKGYPLVLYSNESSSGFTVVLGLAQVIDTVAHETTIEAGGNTVLLQKSFMINKFGVFRGGLKIRVSGVQIPSLASTHSG